MSHIECCRPCVPPKRHPGCHDKCEEYIKEKKHLEEEKIELRKSMPPALSRYDYDEVYYIHSKRHKRKGRRSRTSK